MALGDHDPRWKNPQAADPQSLYLWAQDLIKELRKGEYLSNSISDGIANDQLADMAPWTIKMRNAGTTGDAQDVTINGLTEETSVDGAADFLMMWDTGAGTMDKALPTNLKQAGGFQFLDGATLVADAATISIPLTSYTGYRGFKFFLHIIPKTDDVELYCRVSTDGGANYDATGYSYTNVFSRDGSATAAARSSTAANQIIIAGGAAANEAVSNVAAEGGVHAEVTLFRQTSTTFWPRIRFSTSWYSSDDQTWQNHGAGTRETNQDTDAVRFITESGDIASGSSWAMYGLI